MITPASFVLLCLPSCSCVFHSCKPVTGLPVGAHQPGSRGLVNAFFLAMFSAHLLKTDVRRW